MLRDSLPVWIFFAQPELRRTPFETGSRHQDIPTLVAPGGTSVASIWQVFGDQHTGQPAI